GRQSTFGQQFHLALIRPAVFGFGNRGMGADHNPSAGAMAQPHELEHVLKTASVSLGGVLIASSFLEDRKCGRKKNLSFHNQVEQRLNAGGSAEIQPAPKLIAP